MGVPDPRRKKRGVWAIGWGGVPGPSQEEKGVWAIGWGGGTWTLAGRKGGLGNRLGWGVPYACRMYEINNIISSMITTCLQANCTINQWLLAMMARAREGMYLHVALFQAFQLGKFVGTRRQVSYVGDKHMILNPPPPPHPHMCTHAQEPMLTRMNPALLQHQSTFRNRSNSVVLTHAEMPGDKVGKLQLKKGIISCAGV